MLKQRGASQDDGAAVSGVRGAATKVSGGDESQGTRDEEAAALSAEAASVSGERQPVNWRELSIWVKPIGYVDGGDMNPRA